MAIKQKVLSKKPRDPRINLGFIGEQAVKKHLISKGLEFVSSNYRKKYGEIDLIMRLAKTSGMSERDEKLLFFEVKTVSRERFDGDVVGDRPDISRETSVRQRRQGLRGDFGEYRPEDNVHSFKLKKLSRIIKIWLEENNVGESAEWSFNVALVYLSKTEKKFYIKILWDVIL